MTITNYQQKYHPFYDANILKEILDFTIPIGTENKKLLSTRMLSLLTVNQFFSKTTQQLLAKRPHLLKKELLWLQYQNKFDPTNLRVFKKIYEYVDTLFFTHPLNPNNHPLILKTFHKATNITIDDPSVQILNTLALHSCITNIYLNFSPAVYYTSIDSTLTQLIALQKLNDIQSLSLIFHKEVSNRAMVTLTEIPSITQLHIHNGAGARITDQELQLLPKLKKLSDLMLSGDSSFECITDQGTELLAQIDNLTTLTLYHQHEITAITFQQLQSLPQLQSLTITDCKKISTKNAWSKPLKFPMLESLKIDFSFSTDKNKKIDIVQPLFPKLKFLTFQQTSFKNQDIQYIEKLQLQILTLDECRFDDICPSFENLASKKIVLLECTHCDVNILNPEIFIQFLKNHQAIQPKFQLAIADQIPHDFTLNRFVTKEFMQKMKELLLDGSFNYKTLLKLTQDDGLINPSLILIIDLSTTTFTLTPTELGSLFLVFPAVSHLYVHSDYFQNDYIPVFSEHLTHKCDYKLIHVIHKPLKKEEILLSTYQIQTDFAIDWSHNKNISKDYFEFIHQYNDLQSINFSYCEFLDDELIKTVINSKSLEEVEKIIEMNELEDLKEVFQGLDEINCSFCPKITDATIINLLRLQMLFKYNFQGCLITDKSIDAIIKKFTGRNDILFFDFRQCIHISEQKLLELKNFQNKTLTTIHSDYNI